MSKDTLVKLAQTSVECLARGEALPQASDHALPPELPARAGCFVSIHVRSTDELRGCIGTIVATKSSLAEEIIANAVAAASQDPRFPPITADELDGLGIKVDVLQPAEPATKDELDPRRYGVIVTQGFRRGLLLPDLEGVDSVQEQLDIACAKAGIDPQSKFEIERFEVERHS